MTSKPVFNENIRPFKVEIFHYARRSLSLHPELFSQVTKQPGQASVSNLARLGLYEKYAVVWVREGADDAEALDIAHARTQGASMLGDVFVIDGRPFTVAMHGFKALDSFIPTKTAAKNPCAKAWRRRIALDRLRAPCLSWEIQQGASHEYPSASRR